MPWPILGWSSSAHLSQECSFFISIPTLTFLMMINPGDNTNKPKTTSVFNDAWHKKQPFDRTSYLPTLKKWNVSESKKCNACSRINSTSGGFHSRLWMRYRTRSRPSPTWKVDPNRINSANVELRSHPKLDEVIPKWVLPRENLKALKPLVIRRLVMTYSMKMDTTDPQHLRLSQSTS